MEKLEIVSDDVIVHELLLDKRELFIGRDPSGDVHLDDPLVSRRHARLVRVFSDYYVEDLGSTNGTQVNGRSVRKQLLKPGDSLQIGNFQLRCVGVDEGRESEDLDKTMVIRPAEKLASQRPAGTRMRIPRRAILNFLQGPGGERVEVMDKSLFTIGRPGGSVAAIVRRPQGFFLLHLGGDMHPRANGAPVERGGTRLVDGDLVEVGEHRVRIGIE